MATTLRDASRLDVAIRSTKVALLGARRLASWARSPDAWPRPVLGNAADYPHLAYRREVAIARCDPAADPRLEAGKLQNLALAAPRFDGIALDPTRPLGFWRALGRPSRARGFALGTELRGGCIVPTIGGGLCLLSNALFRAACELGWTIVERHGHTLQSQPVPAGETWGLDATVLWPQVDLRVAPRRPSLLRVQVRGARLRIEVRAREPHRTEVSLRTAGERARGAIRENRIVRVLRDAGGAAVTRDVVAVNRKRVLVPAEQRRTCLTCDERSCHARPRDLAVTR